MVRWSLVLVLSVSLAGCMGSSPDDAVSGADDRVGATWFVLVEDRFTVEDGEPLAGDFGPHCERALYDADADPPSLTLLGDDGEPPFLVVLRRYSEDSLSDPAVRRDESSGLVRYDAGRGGAVGLTAPFAPRLLANVGADGDGVRLAGELLEDGEERTLVGSYEVEGPDGSRSVHESLRVRNLGRIDPVMRPFSGPCD